MAYTIKSTVSDLYRFPTFESREEAAKWARQQTKADLLVTLRSEANGYSEPVYNEDGEIAAYRIIRRWTHDQRGHVPTTEVARVEIVEAQ